MFCCFVAANIIVELCKSDVWDYSTLKRGKMTTVVRTVILWMNDKSKRPSYKDSLFEIQHQNRQKQSEHSEDGYFHK